MLREYSSGPRRERELDLILFGYLRGRFHGVSRQHRLYLTGSTRPSRIDFRLGGSNPVVLEFAVRPPQGGGELYASCNRTELRKLARVASTQARLRALLLVDLSDAPIPQNRLSATYDRQNAGRGNFKRHSVRVVYVHSRQRSYHFLWRPLKQV
jgi:hypothetical protein